MFLIFAISCSRFHLGHTLQITTIMFMEEISQFLMITVLDVRNWLEVLLEKLHVWIRCQISVALNYFSSVWLHLKC